MKQPALTLDDASDLHPLLAIQMARLPPHFARGSQAKATGGEKEGSFAPAERDK